jgi:tyrosyl-tRNA synthetase
MRAHGLREETLVILEYVTGVREEPIGPEERRYIPLNLPPDELYRYIVAIPDRFLLKSFRLITDLDDSELRSVESRISRGNAIRALRKQLARSVVRLFHGAETATLAERDFENRLDERVVCKQTVVMTEDEVREGVDALYLISAVGLAKSEKEAAFLLSDDSILVDGKTIKLGDKVGIFDRVVIQRGRKLRAKTVQIQIRIVPEAVTLPLTMAENGVGAVDLLLISKVAKTLAEASTLLKERRVRLDGVELRQNTHLNVSDGALTEVVEIGGETRAVTRIDLPK